MNFEAPPADNLGAGGGFPTPRAQFINNGFGLGEFLDKRGLVERVNLFAIRFHIDFSDSL